MDKVAVATKTRKCLYYQRFKRGICWRKANVRKEPANIYMFKCSNAAIEAIVKGVKYVQS